MVTIYLTGAVSDFDDPFAWHDEVEEEWGDEYDFVNPYNLNDFELGDDDVYERPSVIVEPALEAVRKADGMVVRWDDDAFLVGTSMEMKEAFENDVPIVVWYDGWKDNLSPWILHTTVGRWEDRDTCIRVLLGLLGETEAMHGE